MKFHPHRVRSSSSSPRRSMEGVGSPYRSHTSPVYGNVAGENSQTRSRAISAAHERLERQDALEVSVGGGDCTSPVAPYILTGEQEVLSPLESKPSGMTETGCHRFAWPHGYVRSSGRRCRSDEESRPDGKNESLAVSRRNKRRKSLEGFEEEEATAPPPTTDSTLELSRYWAGVIVNNEKTRMVIITFIIVNCIMMGIGTFDFVSENHRLNSIFEISDRVFLIIFTVELAVQFFHHGLALFDSGWLTFDFFIVFVSWAFSGLTIIRAFRIVRALRIITRVEGMKELVLALLNVLPRMFAIGCLMLLVFYVFAVMFTQLFKHSYEEGYTSADYFSRLDITCMTLFQIMTLDSWSMITKELMTQYSWAWIPVFTFVMISSFVVINLIIAVICDAVSELHREDVDTVIQRMNSQNGGDMSLKESGGDVARLERKIEELTFLVDALLRSQNQPVPTLQQAPQNEALAKALQPPKENLAPPIPQSRTR